MRAITPRGTTGMETRRAGVAWGGGGGRVLGWVGWVGWVVVGGGLHGPEGGRV